MYYKNVSLSVKTFHGVTFRPGEIKEVDKYINSNYMIKVEGLSAKTAKDIEEASKHKQKQQKPSSEKSSKKDEDKKESEVSVEDAVEISDQLIVES